ncbi:CaiB/BaiF CoA transferase family protein [Paraglaciecola chathamensis]|uniref:Isomerase n=1 Tax=Paraglaciecola chathamensis TaxID=368405 RepID=A0A8H9IA69_9ALTE|nr:CoA transferase [Paraglaciecola oceanifecundans]GGZ64074.1 isomerase [Paraglaciecola oceanifecundans]
MSQILDGIQVLDFGRYIAGPFCATLLGDLGAQVIRVEKPKGGEDRYTVPVTSEGEGAYFMQIGRNKKSMTLNPMTEQGQIILKKLVKRADVVVVNVPPSALKKMGLDYDSLCAINPSIILTINTAFGTSGPYAERGGFDTIAQAMSGNMHLSGDAGQPGKSFAPYCDFGTASLSALGTLAAIMHKMKTGEGQVVQGSLLSTALTFNNAALIEESILHTQRQGSATRGQYNAPTDTFATQDGWVSVQVVGQGLFKRWCQLLAEQSWLEDPQLQTDQGRGNNGQRISKRMGQWCQEHTNQSAMAALAKAGIPAAEVLTPAQTLCNEQVVATKQFQTLDYPHSPAPAPIAGHPIGYSKSPIPAFKRAPTLGEHTQDILKGLGYDSAQIDVLKETGVI